MAFRALSRRNAAIPLAIITAGALLPKRSLHAEAPEPDTTPHTRKPIYDDPSTHTPPPPTTNDPSSSPTAPSPSGSSPYTTTPTARLAAQIARLRLSLHTHAVHAEDTINALATRTFALEHRLTSTISSLAPPPSSTERLLPGVLYILVASMAGSILTRRRNILLRFAVPAAVGVGAAYAVLPVTTGNVARLVGDVERRYVPGVVEVQGKVGERVGRFVRTGWEHSRMSVGMVEERVGRVREGVEGWVRKGN